MDFLRVYRRLKRRRMMDKRYKTKPFANMGSGVDSLYGNAASPVQEDLVDEDYQEYVNFLLGLQDEIDNEYSTFLGKLKPDGSSFLFETMVDGGLYEVRYALESIPHPNNRPPAYTKKRQGKVSVRHRVRTKKNRRSLHGKNVAKRKDKRSNNRPVACVGQASKLKSGSDEGYSDSDVELLRDSFEIDSENNIILKTKVVNPVRYDETPEHSYYSQSSSDSEIVVMDSDPYRHGNTPFVVEAKSVYIDLTKDEEGLQLGLDDESQFKKGLMETLEAPYDEVEYQDRKLEVSRQRNKECERELRSGRTRPLPFDNAFYHSYLDQYSDLDEKIKEFSEPHNELFLLRGFFYWLEHSPLERSFKPWLDPSLLEMLGRQ